ncbi:MAG: DUF1848 domain-containing protein [Bacillota bacterium]|nr:DUF1848 domain-containing protein [Bacillota bacterium]MDD3298939.1 DUF1848 domain-containing protein [Bacillota bacterium]MDD3851358.1 DUF1848 domain-containing protein [Bacillota bacterium]MDD4707993.1 DUF1848 domain-containing protein [Bacillota bacterium]
MIISASRRTDIPNYYPDWFYNRIREGYALVRNPVNVHQVSKVRLTPDVVDCIVFWTKNPTGMIERLNELKEYHHYFQFTLNPYGKDVEPGLPPDKEDIIGTFIRLSDRIGPEGVIWRYDPILLSDKYSISYHLHHFGEFARKLKGFTVKCIISFIDLYRKTTNNVKNLGLHTLTEQDKAKIAEGLSKIAIEFDLQVDTCAESIDLAGCGIGHAKCIDPKLIEKLNGCKINVGKDKGQRPECGWVESIDIGMNNTCPSGCKYCYANYGSKTIHRNIQYHNPNGALLCGTIANEDRVTERSIKSFKDNRLYISKYGK